MSPSSQTKEARLPVLRTNEEHYISHAGEVSRHQIEVILIHVEALPEVRAKRTQWLQAAMRRA